jgi:predicted metalloprotease with PDZ domain
VQISVFRRDELRHVSITLGAAPKDKLEIVPVKGASDAQKQAYQAWMGEALA